MSATTKISDVSMDSETKMSIQSLKISSLTHFLYLFVSFSSGMLNMISLLHMILCCLRLNIEFISSLLISFLYLFIQNRIWLQVYCLLFMRLMCVCTREYDANWLWIINGLKMIVTGNNIVKSWLYTTVSVTAFLLFIYDRTLHTGVKLQQVHTQVTQNSEYK